MNNTATLFTVREVSGICVVAFAPETELHTNVCSQIMERMNPGKHLVLDLEHVTFASVGFFAELFRLKKKLTGNNQNLAICNAEGAPFEFFKINPHSYVHLNIKPKLEQALVAVQDK